MAIADEISFPNLQEQIKIEYSYKNLKHFMKIRYEDYLTFERNAPGSLVPSYVGVHEIIVNQVEKRLKHIANERVRQLLHHSNMPYGEIKREIELMNGSTNPYGNWWNRDWYFSLPENKGGAPKTVNVVNIGKEIHIPNWPVISFIKKQYERLGDIWIQNDHIFDEDEETADATMLGQTIEQRKKDNDIEDFNKIKVKQTSVIVETDEIKSEWFKSKFYHFRFKPFIRIKGDKEAEDIVDEISLRFVIELFKNKRQLHFANIDFFIRYDIKNKDTFGSITFSFLTW